ncbi:TatD family hydrolase [Priestia koreensis]|uniref:TatD family hydrolase n=1 Tax=Priestia koreensis TaxID=284581 RepID=UPI0028F72A67|nr:TatD family hydrolase [Priestia koreensis]
MYDAHIHLDQYPDVDRSIAQWQEAGVKGVVAVSTNLRSSYDTLLLKQKYPDFITAAIGFHPEEALPSVQDVTEWKSLLLKERSLISAIGEVGLPYYSAFSNDLPSYLPFLEDMMMLANEYELPIILHAVHSGAPIAFDLLRKHGVKNAHFHWLKASSAVVKQIVEAGYYVSVTPEVCYRERDQLLAKRVPLSQLLAETDGPWPFDGPFENRPTSPILLKESILTLSRLLEKPVHEVEAHLASNVRELFFCK